MTEVGKASRPFTIHINSKDKVSAADITNTNADYVVNLHGMVFMDDAGNAPKFYKLYLDKFCVQYSNSTYRFTSDNTGYLQLCLGFSGTP